MQGFLCREKDNFYENSFWVLKKVGFVYIYPAIISRNSQKLQQKI